jgi:hypothetical protein
MPVYQALIHLHEAPVATRPPETFGIAVNPERLSDSIAIEFRRA